MTQVEEELLIEKQEKTREYKKYLDDTDFKFTDDYDKKDTDEWLEIKQKRQEYREFLRSME